MGARLTAGQRTLTPPVQVRILCPQPTHSFKMFHFLAVDVKVSRNWRIAKSWIQRICVNGKPTHMGLGAYLAMARDITLVSKDRRVEF